VKKTWIYTSTRMTRTKLEFATILASIRGQGEDPQKLAQEMTLRKLCHEIEKAEEAKEAAPKVAEAPPKKEKRHKSLWEWITLEESDDE
jgi:hypothetical protein